MGSIYVGMRLNGASLEGNGCVYDLFRVEQETEKCN